MIPAQAVEAAARAIWERVRIDPFSDATDPLHAEACRLDARAALEAAAPHMLAGVYALMEDPEHYDSQGPSAGYVSVDNLRAALDSTP